MSAAVEWMLRLGVVVGSFALVLLLCPVGGWLLLRLVAWWSLRPVAPVVWLGWQPDADGGQFALYNLTEDIKGHPAGSTVSSRTLKRAGYRLPHRWQDLFSGGSQS